MISSAELQNLRVAPMDTRELASVDAQATLAEALVTAAAPVNRQTVEAAFFLSLYLGDYGRELANYAMSFKAQQSVGGIKHIKDAIKSFAALDMIKPTTIGMGGSNK